VEHQEVGVVEFLGDGVGGRLEAEVRLVVGGQPGEGGVWAVDAV
jgi:hypothetical protein